MSLHSYKIDIIEGAMQQSKSDKENSENSQSNSSKVSRFCYSSSSFIDNPNSG